MSERDEYAITGRHITGRPEVKAAALRGQVTIELPAPMAYGLGWLGERTWASVALTITQADELIHAITQAQLIAAEQAVRAHAYAGRHAAPEWDSPFYTASADAANDHDDD